jgi:hypothetical protein
MERHIPYPIKQMRQKQAAEAKLLTAQQRQRSGVLKEQAKLREAEAAEKAANKERLKTPPTTDPNGDADNNQEHMPNPITGLLDSQETGDTAPKGPTRTQTADSEILLEKVNTPEGDASEISQDFTLSVEGEGDNISGNKELRKEGDDEDENISKRAKGPPQAPAAE